MPDARNQWRVEASSAGTRLDKFLAARDRLGSRSRAADALDRGKVFLNDDEMTMRDASRALATGDVVRLWQDRPGSARPTRAGWRSGDLNILFEDEALLVIDKPPGLLSVPLERKAGARSVYDLLENYFRSHGKRKPLVVHRIDRDTSGLVIFAKTHRAQIHLKDQFRRREPERLYLAVVYGHPEPRQGTWRDFLTWDAKAMIQKATSPSDPRGTEAIAEYCMIEAFRDTSLLEVRLHTGKRNQIRIQARLRGHTLVGERRYVFGPEVLRPITFGRQALHAWRLTFAHPADERTLRFEAPVPADFADLLSHLRVQ